MGTGYRWEAQSVQATRATAFGKQAVGQGRTYLGAVQLSWVVLISHAAPMAAQRLHIVVPFARDGETTTGQRSWRDDGGDDDGDDDDGTAVHKQRP
jgi:hypothetical protein